MRNEGRITAGPGGFVVLAADRVENSGLLAAERGEVLLASGSALTLSLDAEGLVAYSIDAAALSGRAGVENLGEIVANGGSVMLDAEVAHSLIGKVVNNQGRITAQSIEEHDGAIYLMAEGGDIENSGTLDASGAGQADGGRVILRGDRDLSLTDTGVIAAAGAGSGDGGLIRVIAEGQADTAAGSVISATAGPAGRLGGFVELSGHGGLRVRGQVDVGRHGRLLIDPTVVNIANGNGTSGSAAGTATVFEQFIETQLRRGADVAIVASDRIRLDTLTDGLLDGRNAGAGGNLLLGIGSVFGSSNGLFVDGPPPAGFGFNPGPGDSSAGGIFFQSLGNAIRVDGQLELAGGTARGQISVGNLEGSRVGVEVNNGTLSVGSILANGGFSSAGDIDIEAKGTGTITHLGAMRLRSAGFIDVFAAQG
ncbi:MAG: hypothetical protein ACREE7_19530, partial [Dongiaceae bacterium]